MINPSFDQPNPGETSYQETALMGPGGAVAPMGYSMALDLASKFPELRVVFRTVEVTFGAWQTIPHDWVVHQAKK